ncbi:uncharacterized protein LOC142583427 isoform X2 [Dermacentor variabilis]|uniref:uncharacterized protein LOC142583427 isoform X2 n=1 Tax=Dermacentor variabilis TaxID=34621 RepID=UPI003F5B9317
MFCRDNPGRAFLSSQSTAKSDSNTGHQWNSAVPLQCCGNCLHQRFATTVLQHVGDNAYEIIGPDHESPQGANNISVAEVSPVPLGSYHDR